MSIDHIINRIYNSKIGKVILIGDSTTLLHYGYQFISLYAMDGRLWLEVRQVVICIGY